MKKGQKLWTREELILAVNLYWKMEFGKTFERNPEIKKFANFIGRTPGSVVFKLGNFGSFDYILKERGVGDLKIPQNLIKKYGMSFLEN